MISSLSARKADLPKASASNAVASSERRKFSRGGDAPAAEAGTGFVRRDVDGLFRNRRGMAHTQGALPPGQHALNAQYVNNAINGLAVALKQSGRGYVEFQHNGQNAVLQRVAGTDDHSVSFSNGHGPSSLLQRVLHPRKPFQFSFNSATNQVRQVNGPQQLTPAQTAAALEAVKLSFQQQVNLGF